MTVFVDTSVFSLAWRRDAPADLPQIERFAEALQAGEVISTGVVLQELLQGFAGPKSAAAITERFAAIPLLTPIRDDHIQAAALRNRCRQAGIQIGTIDALLAQLCIARELTMLTADADFQRIAGQSPLRVWSQPTR